MKTNTLIFKNGFTLAEVLITLGIIGVVAALTIPAVINSTQEKEYKTAYRNAYADLYNAFNKAKYDGEFRPVSEGAAAVRADFDAIKANFKVVLSCENSLTDGCWVDSCEVLKDCSPSTLSGEGQGKSFGFIDSAGRSWSHYKPGVIPFQYPWFIFDTNGLKGPNSFGRDRWYFMFEDSAGTYDNTAGDPFKIRLPRDILTQQENGCIKGNCYYKSWLIGY